MTWDADDFAAFFDADMPGYTTTVFNAATVPGLFRAAFVSPLDVAGSEPTFTCASAAVPGIKRGDALVINSKTYKVKTPRPDANGIVTLPLEEQ